LRKNHTTPFYHLHSFRRKMQHSTVATNVVSQRIKHILK